MGSPFQIDVIKSESFKQLSKLTAGGGRAFRQAVKDTTEAVAREGEKLMKKVLREGEIDGKRSNSPFTLAILIARAKLSRGKYQGGFPQSPLFRNKEIHDNIRTVKLRGGDFFVGLTSKRRMKSGFDRRKPNLVTIAKINEEGATINVAGLSDTSRRRIMNFFLALTIAVNDRNVMRPLRANTVIRIPKRSFRTPVTKAFNQSGFGAGITFERAAERAFLKSIKKSKIFGRFLKVVGA